MPDREHDHGDEHGPYGHRQRCVGAVVFDERQRLLVIRRANPPGQGLWSLPGGRVEPGETDADAVVREMGEETGLEVEPGGHIGTVVRSGPGGVIYDIHDYRATVAGGRLTAGDDASDARWVTGGELRELPTAPGLIEALTEWEALPAG